MQAPFEYTGKELMFDNNSGPSSKRFGYSTKLMVNVKTLRVGKAVYGVQAQLRKIAMTYVDTPRSDHQ